MVKQVKASHSEDGNEDRRTGGDRRKAQTAFAGADRRKGNRRSGVDRRKSPRLKQK